MERDAVIVGSRPVAGSVDELLDGARRIGRERPGDARSSAGFEQVELDGERCVVKYVDPRSDFTMRVTGDIGCRPRRAWQLGLMDLAPASIDHATLGVAPWGPNGWGAAILMRDVSAELVPMGDDPITEEQHAAFLGGIAALAAASWGWEDDHDLLAPERRWAMFGDHLLLGDEALGWPEDVPRIANDGWQRFAERVPADVRDSVRALTLDPAPLVQALRTSPWCFLHGDWKLGNLGVAADGRVVLIDWAYPGIGPVCHELGWYLALNRSRLPVGHTKERVADDLRAALAARGIETHGWWEHQLALCLLGAVVEFGWEKALGDKDELDWWLDRARAGLDEL